MCVLGQLKVGVYRERDKRQWVAIIGQMRPAILIIPPPLWHGVATVGPDSAGLIYYVTKAYDPADPDEQRQPYDALPDFPWGVCHR